MTEEHTDTTTIVTGAAPSVAAALGRAATIAADAGRDWFGVEDLLAALLAGPRLTPLEAQWRRRGLGSLSFSELSDLVRSAVPGRTPGNRGPSAPASVDFRAVGPLAEEYTALVDGA
ncbi:hypothetical protein ACWEQ0_10940 [Nocardia thailandica]